VLTAAPLWTVLLVAPGTGSWRPPELEVAPPPPVRSFDQLQSIALRYLGRPYVWGGVGTPGLDCSGFTCRVFAEAGYAIPRVSRDQARVGERVPLTRIAPGDLLFFAEDGGPVSHVGIYLGEGQMVHASSGQGEVVVDTLRRRWFGQNLVSARRVLSSTLTKGADDLLVITELSEHDGRFRLSPFVRRRAGEPDPGLAPTFLTGGGTTHVGARGGVVTQDGRAGGLLAPELGLAWRKHGVSVRLGLPIRLDPIEGAEIGGVRDASDALRFVREVRAGVPDADLEIAFQRERAYRLGAGGIVRDYAPLFGAQLIPGLGTRGAPLAGYAHVRIDALESQLLVDDVAAPGVVGASAALHLPRGFGAQTTGAVDLRTADDRDLYAARASGFFRSPADRVLQLEVDAGGAMSGLGGDRAGSFDAEATLRVRFGDRYANLVGFGGRFGYAFDGGLWDVFGPTYAAARTPTAAAFGAAGGRPLGGGHVLLRVGPLESSLRYHQGIDGDAGPLDRTVEIAARLADLPLAGTRTLSLRGGYAARAPFSATDRVDVAYARLGIRLTKLLSLEGYGLLGDAWEGGTTLRFAWTW
jgi:hypothetical protein